MKVVSWKVICFLLLSLVLAHAQEQTETQTQTEAAPAAVASTSTPAFDVASESGEDRWALALIPPGCKTRNLYPKAYDFIRNDASHYANLDVKLVGGVPRVKFFKTKEERDGATVDGTRKTIEELMAMVAAGPENMPPAPKPLHETDFDEMSLKQIRELFKEQGVPRGFPAMRDWMLELERTNEA